NRVLTVGDKLIVIDANRAQSAEESINGAVAHAADFVVNILEAEQAFKMHLSFAILSVILFKEFIPLEVAGILKLILLLVDEIKSFLTMACPSLGVTVSLYYCD